MQFDYGYSEEEQLDKTYDIRLIKKLYPLIRPYLSLLFVSMFLIILIAAMDLSLPYITKIAIDQYIVPHTNVSNIPNDLISKEKTRYFEVDMAIEEFRRIVEKYPEVFKTHQTFAFISYDDLKSIDKKDLQILRKKDISGLGRIAALFLLLIFFNFFLNFFQVMLMEYTGQMAMHNLRTQLFEHISGLSVTFFARNPVGRLVTRITNDVQNMHELFTSIIVFLFKDFFLLAGITIILITIDWQLACISFIVIPFGFYLSVYFSRQARDLFRTLRIKLAEINTKFSETAEGIKVIQLFLHEKENYRIFSIMNHENYTAGIKQIHVYALFMPVIEVLGSTATAMIIYYGGGRVVSETISLGSLVAFISYIKMFFTPLRDIAEKYNVMQNAMASAERIFLILDKEKGEDESITTGIITGENKGVEIKAKVLWKIDNMEFSNVYFSYANKEPVLKGISFKIKKGEKIAIIGHTGAGKTSLINLILRFYSPVSGKILINEKNLKEFDLSSLRSKIAIVTQEPFLFSGTIKENIVNSNIDISDYELNILLKAAQCSKLINRLPHGLETVLAEGGKSISSGERQLISIARAFVHNPDLLILDEATSYIDSKTEEQVSLALVNLMKNRTSIVVAHRLSTTLDADKILVLNKGRIIESGNHNDLMQQKGFYFKLNQF